MKRRNPFSRRKRVSGLEPNPIIVKELRSRMRGVRAFAILTGVLLLLAGISYLLYRIVLAATRYSSMPVSPQVGQTLFVGLVVVELMMVCFITPAVTAGSISSEQEKLTYEMLLATPLRPASILWGKLISALSYILLLIFAAVPMASLVFIFGGVALWDMVKALVVLVATVVLLGVIGIFMSVWLKRTMRATVLSYLAVLGLLVGPPILYIFVGVLKQAAPPRWILVPNPMSALFSALPTFSPYGGPIDLLSGLRQILSGNLDMMNGSMATGVPRPLYHYTLPLYGALSLALYLLATRLIRPTRRWPGWTEALVVAALFLILAGAVALPFALTVGRYEKVPVPPASMAMPFMPAPVVVEREVVRVVEAEPTPTPVPPPTPVPTPMTEAGETPAIQPATVTLPPADQAAIYAAAIRQLYTVDHMYGNRGRQELPDLATIDVLRTTDDGVGDSSAPRSASILLPKPVQAAVGEALADLGPGGSKHPVIQWVAVPEPPDESEAGSRAVITLGNIHVQPDGTAWVSIQLAFSTTNATGKTYVLERVGGTSTSLWQVVGDTGVQWSTSMEE